MKLLRCFTSHPASLGETYTQHNRAALGYAGPLALAALAALVHAFFPFLFKATASRTIVDLNRRIAARCAVCPSGRDHRPDLFSDEIATRGTPALGQRVAT